MNHRACGICDTAMREWLVWEPSAQGFGSTAFLHCVNCDRIEEMATSIPVYTTADFYFHDWVVGW